MDSSLEINSYSIHVINRCTAFEIELNEVKSLLEHIDPNKAAGPDGVYGRILKEGSNSIAKALYLIFKQSIAFGEVPEDWKTAYLILSFKKVVKKI